jgi:hypothetical protein
LTYFNSEI